MKLRLISASYILMATIAIAMSSAILFACSSDEPKADPAAPSKSLAESTAAPAAAKTDSTAESAESDGPKQWGSPPPLTIDQNKKYTAVFELEKGAEFEIELYADKVPNTVNNFVFLSREGYYNGVTFHRVIPNFMAQSGDPTGTGRGGPGYRFADEFHPDLRHDSPGILSMANAGENTNGSQFFITFVPTPSLDDGHAVFGKVTKGMDVVNAISLRDPSTATTPGDVISTIRIVEE